MEPYLSDKPRAAAALIVAAARASGILMWRLTQARCITIGLRGEGGRGEEEGGREAERMGGGWGRCERKKEGERQRGWEGGGKDGREKEGERQRGWEGESKREGLEKREGKRDRQMESGDSISVTRLFLFMVGLCTRLTIDMQKAFGLKSLPRATATPEENLQT